MAAGDPDITWGRRDRADGRRHREANEVLVTVKVPSFQLVRSFLCGIGGALIGIIVWVICAYFYGYDLKDRYGLDDLAVMVCAWLAGAGASLPVGERSKRIAAIALLTGLLGLWGGSYLAYRAYKVGVPAREKRAKMLSGRSGEAAQPSPEGEQAKSDPEAERLKNLPYVEFYKALDAERDRTKVLAICAALGLIVGIRHSHGPFLRTAPPKPHPKIKKTRI